MTDEQTKTPTCVSCRVKLPVPFLDLGELPLGNALLDTPESPDPRYPLRLAVCHECWLVQQTEPPPAAALVKDYREYKYVPVGDSLRTSLYDLGRELAHRARRGFVLDIGSNDGVLLSGAQAGGARVLGVEPAESISAEARERGIPAMTSFFSRAVAREVEAVHGRADVVVTTQTMQHVPDPGDFIDGVKALLRPEGIFVIEGRYFRDTMELVSYDTIYHEMLTYSTLVGLRNLLRRHGFGIVEIERARTHGGSIRVYAKHPFADIERGPFPGKDLLDSEIAAGYGSPGVFDAFSVHVDDRSRQLAGRIASINANSGYIVGYGAPSTSVTLLGHAKISQPMVHAIAEDNPRKVGKFHPGTKIPILAPDQVRKLNPTHVLRLPRQFRDEIVRKTESWNVGYL